MDFEMKNELFTACCGADVNALGLCVECKNVAEDGLVQGEVSANVSDSEMFEMMLASIGVTSVVGIPAKVQENLLDEVDNFAMEIDFHHNGSKYVSDKAAFFA